MQSSAQEVTMLFKLIAAAKDSWACFFKPSLSLLLTTSTTYFLLGVPLAKFFNHNVISMFNVDFRVIFQCMRKSINKIQMMF